MPDTDSNLSPPFKSSIPVPPAGDDPAATFAGLADVLARVEAEIARECVTGEAERVAAVLWIAHTYAYEAFKLTPRLFVTSPGPGCGKSTLLQKVVDMSANEPALRKRFGRVTEAFLGRSKKPGKPLTVVMDQLDNTLSKQEYRLIDTLCAGAEQGIASGLTAEVTRGKTKTHSPELHDFFYPIALGKIGKLPDAALNSRCLTIEMFPAAPAEADRLFHENRDTDPEIAKELHRVLFGRSKALAARRPDMPKGFRNRRRDKWHPLIAIADAAGGEWGRRARDAAVVLDNPDERASDPVATLRDTVEVLKGWPRDEISSEELADKLNGMPRPSEISQTLVTRHLKDTGVKDTKVYGRTKRGFKVSAIWVAATRYFPAEAAE